MLLLVLHVFCWVRVMTTASPRPAAPLIPANGLSLWIDEGQVKNLNGIPMDIYAILDGHVLPYILDPSFEKYLPIIPSEVAHINFTWKSGRQKYHYNFDQLLSFNQALLDNPSVSIATRGLVPNRAAVFTVFLACSGNVAGVASFGLGLMLRTLPGRALRGSPLRIRLQKQCTTTGLCQDGCLNGGSCRNAVCVCGSQFYGPRCQFSRCTKPCKNGGRCVGLNRCKCGAGFHGHSCHLKKEPWCRHHQCRRCRIIQDENGKLKKSCHNRHHSSQTPANSWT